MSTDLLDDRVIVSAAREAARRFRLRPIELAALSGLSEHTARDVMRGDAPAFARCLRGLASFADRARKAKSRTDLGLGE
jgi:hypothetical protein